MLPLIAVAQPPLYRATCVWTPLAAGVTLTDVRRDRRAIGTIPTGKMTLGYAGAEHFALFEGKAERIEASGEGEEWDVTPVAITGPDTFAIAFQNLGMKRTYYREARVTGGTIRVGDRVPKPTHGPRGMAAGAGEPVRIPGEWWGDLPMTNAAHGPEASARWYGAGGAWRIGSGSVSRTEEAVSSDPDSDVPRDPVVGSDEIALVRENGLVRPLATRTIDAPSAGLGEVLFVSREGWIVTRAGQDQGLVWLEPVTRQE